MTGSSPRVRGSLDQEYTLDGWAGIIPAGAGLTRICTAASAACWDHPRGCGAHVPAQIMLFYMLGSSPRVRGSPRLLFMRDSFSGIIPAGAGLTANFSPEGRLSRDHPRGCGAHLSLIVYGLLCWGSSPRVRGSLERDLQPVSRRGIIPAGAGLTPVNIVLQILNRDHPRGCGAHLYSFLLSFYSRGSSPRVRGSRRQLYTPRLRQGIIPAGAGLTLKNPNSCTIPYLPKAQNHSLLTILTGYSL